LLPFGPLLFRLSYPERAARARIFGLISLPCYLGFFAFGSGLSMLSFGEIEKDFAETSQTVGYASENTDATKVADSTSGRRTANEAEFPRLHGWSEKLVATKRDLLNSDVEGTRRYNEDAAKFNAALTAANAEKAKLDSSP